MPSERDVKEEGCWNAHRFDVVHVKNDTNTTRTFTAPKDVCDAWVFSINQVLLKHAKAKQAAARENCHCLPGPQPV